MTTIINELNKYVISDISHIITSLKIYYETIDKYNKVITQFKQCNRSDNNFKLLFKYKTKSKQFLSIWCPHCGEKCMITVYGAECLEHGLMIIDYYGLRFIKSMINILLSNDENYQIINQMANWYDFD